MNGFVVVIGDVQDRLRFTSSLLVAKMPVMARHRFDDMAPSHNVIGSGENHDSFSQIPLSRRVECCLNSGVELLEYTTEV